MILVPFIASIMYLVGGQYWRAGRWFMGVPIFIVAIVTGHAWYSIFLIPAFFIATNIFVYGEKSWLNFLGEWGKFFVSGLSLGACSFIVLPLWLAVLQSLVSGISFLVIKYLDDNGIVKNPFVELLRGACGTILYIFI